MENKTRLSPRHSLRHRAGKLSFLEAVDSQEDSDLDNSSSNKPLPPPVITPTTRIRKRKSTPLKASVSGSKCPKTASDMSSKHSHKVVSDYSNDSEDSSSRSGRLRGQEKSNANSSDRSKCNEIDPGVHIKEEPCDSGYGDSKTPGPGKSPNRQSPVLNIPSGSKPSRETSNETDGKLKGNDVPIARVDQRTLKKLVEKIKRQEMRNQSLQEELEESLRENQSIQEQLQSRDEQIAELATAFFSLNNQFQMIAHRFKMALSTNTLDRNLDVLDDNDNEEPS